MYKNRYYCCLSTHYQIGMQVPPPHKRSSMEVMPAHISKKKSDSPQTARSIFFKSAQEKTRTFTSVRSLHPECSASTNSATWAKTPFKKQCPGQDSNLHTVTGASPSSWCVYQFHHLGKKWCKSNTLFHSASIFEKKSPTKQSLIQSMYNCFSCLHLIILRCTFETQQIQHNI